MLIDTRGDYVSYLLDSEGIVRVFESPSLSDAAPLIPEGSLPLAGLEIVPFSYEQLRAIALDHASFGIFEPDFLSVEDRRLVDEVGESYSQIGGHHFRAINWGPVCQNPECLSFGSGSCELLVSIGVSPIPGFSFTNLPQDPVFEFYICIECQSISGVIACD